MPFRSVHSPPRYVPLNRWSQAVSTGSLGRTGRDQRRRFAGEPHAAVELGEVERLDPETIAAQQQPVPTHIKGSERELTAQLATPRPGPTARATTAASRCRWSRRTESVQLAAQLAVVVDLSVVGEPPLATRMVHRLMAVRAEVDDRQAACEPARRCR